MRSGLGLLFADALIDGVLIVNQMRATHTIFHCTCTVQSIAGWIAGTGTPDLYDNLSCINQVRDRRSPIIDHRSAITDQ